MSKLNIGLKIKQLRMEQGLNQTELAKALCVTNSTISNWENGHRLPSVEELYRLATFFNTTLGCFDPSSTDASCFKSGIEKGPSQTIEFLEIGYQSSKQLIIIFFLSIVLVLLSFLMPNIIEFSVYALGASGLAFVIIHYLMSIINRRQINVKKIVIPMELKACYIHQYDDEKIKKAQSTAFLVIVSLLFFSVLSYGFIIYLFHTFDSIWIDILIAFYSVIGILLSFFRYRIVHQKKMFSKRLFYYDVNKNLKFFSFSIGFIVDVFMFAFAVLVFVIFKDTFVSSTFVFLVLFIFMVYTSLSYLVFVTYKMFVSKYEVYVESSDNHITRLF
jgi:transcriptional regulator with XRE-family HTH domain